MNLLDTDQILGAVGRALATHVLPALDDDYARIQVEAALTALEEVRHRLAEGDPLAGLNAGYRERLAAFADELRSASPEAATRVDAARAHLDDDTDPREQHRRLSEELTRLLADPDPALAGLRRLVEELTMTATAADARWICNPAIESLQ